MDYDDIDYFQRRDVNNPATTDATKLHNLTALRASGLKFTEVTSGDLLVFKERGKPTVEFYTRGHETAVRVLAAGMTSGNKRSTSFLSKWTGLRRMRASS